MARSLCKIALFIIVVLILPLRVQAQSATYHLHKEASSTSGLFQLKTAGPDGSSLAIQSTDLINKATGEYLIKAFDTQSGVPNASGTIPAGSTITYTLWMKKTANFGTMVPRAKVFFNSSAGTLLCSVTGSTALTTTLTKYTFNCTTASAINMAASDRFYLWVGVNLTTGPGNHSVKAEVDVEGTLNGNFDSLITTPLPVPPPAISGLTPSSGAVGASVTVGGSNFGATQGASTVKFNGVTATPTSWGATSIAVPVPAGAGTGPVVVTVGGVASNGVIFTVVTTGTIVGTITRASDATALSGAFVEALQGSTVIASNTSAANGTYSIGSLAPGTYNVRVSATGFVTATATNKTVSAGATTTVNVALSASPGTISGKITKADGVTAISGATVKAYQGVTVSGTATTNGTGDYTIANLSAGTYSVEASGSGYEAKSQPGVSVSSGGTTTLNFSLILARITYVYDELRRLIAVSDPATDTAIYSYDSVGNLLSISRQNSGFVSIIKFNPVNGLAGATVTIHGTGFSVTPGLNTVKFNGVMASVISSTATQIVVSVPPAATMGPIVVIAPSGTATSGIPFTVGTADAEPVITNFTPTIGSPGATVTVNGANFETSVANNKVAFNNRFANVSTAATGSLATSVPAGATSGHIFVTTPVGKAVSGGDFFVPPTPFTATDVQVADRLAFGVGKAVALPTANKVALLVFDATAGQRVILSLNNVTIGASFCCEAHLTIYKPDSSTYLASTMFGTDGIFTEPMTLPVTGTYTILIDPDGANTGNATATIYDVPSDLNLPITPGGPTVNATISGTGQVANLTFSGTAGQRISLLMISALTGGTGFDKAILNLYNPDGSALVLYSINFDDNYLLAITLPTTGTYRVFMDPKNSYTGNVAFTLYDVPADTTTPITAGGSAVTVTTTVPGQKAKATFSGTAGQRVSFKLSGVTLTNAFVLMLNPDGSERFSGVPFGTSGLFFDPMELFTTGTYTIVIEGGLTNSHTIATGSATLNLYTVPADTSGTVTIGGAAVPVTLTVPGQNGQLTFSGTSGQQVTVRVTGNTMGSVRVSLLNPDGSTLTSSLSSSASFNLTRKTLGTTGTYTVRIDPDGANTGALNISVTSP